MPCFSMGFRFRIPHFCLRYGGIFLQVRFVDTGNMFFSVCVLKNLSVSELSGTTAGKILSALNILGIESHSGRGHDTQSWRFSEVSDRDCVFKDNSSLIAFNGTDNDRASKPDPSSLIYDHLPLYSSNAVLSSFGLLLQERQLPTSRSSVTSRRNDTEIDLVFKGLALMAHS